MNDVPSSISTITHRAANFIRKARIELSPQDKHLLVTVHIGNSMHCLPIRLPHNVTFTGDD